VKLCGRRFSFCPKCGGELSLRSVAGRERLVCDLCGYVLYENPVVGVAVIVQNDNGAILLGRRSKDSTYSGLWCIPCGYVEYDEEVRVAARREFFEETGLEVEIGEVFTVLSNFHNPETHTVGIWFWAEVIGGTIKAGDDLDAIDWVSINNPPPLAFATDQVILEMLNKK
jgi:ADP-ribose pyrophosphatase YjhB (NUDIX family)